MQTDITVGGTLEDAVATAESFGGYEVSAGRKDAIYHVGQFIFSQDAEAFNDVYAQLTDAADNSPEYVVHFSRTVSQLTEILGCGKAISGQ